MRYVSLFLALFILSAGCMFGQASLWDKQGIAAGTVNDILIFPPMGMGDFADYFIATEHGVYQATEPYNSYEGWTEMNMGLKSGRIYKIAGVQLDPTNFALAVFAEDGVYARLTTGPAWIRAGEQGINKLDELFAEKFIGYPAPHQASLTMVDNGDGTYRVFLGVKGVGLFRKDFCGAGWCTGSTLPGYGLPHTFKTNATGGPGGGIPINPGPCRIIVLTPVNCS